MRVSVYAAQAAGQELPAIIFIMRIAFFGGSFDPPHLGHLRIATAAADRLNLDRILFAPSALQPLKQERDRPGASYADRLEMVQLLIGSSRDIRFEASSLDAPRPDGRPNYTYDTIARLREEIGTDHKLFVLIGADALNTLPMWHRALELVQETDFIVVSRPGFSPDEQSHAPYTPLLRLHTPSRIVKRDSPAAEVEHLTLIPHHHDSIDSAICNPANFYILNGLSEDISATAIRDVIAALSPSAIAGLTKQVIEYITLHSLYRGSVPRGTLAR